MTSIQESMAKRQGLLLLIFALVIAPVAVASGRTRGPLKASRTSSGHRYVTKPGNYKVTIRVASPAGPQRVVVKVPRAARRVVFVHPQTPAKLTFKTAVRRGPLSVTVVGTRFKPKVSVAVTPVPATATPTTGTPANPSPPTPASASTAPAYTNLVWSDEFAGPQGAAPSSSNWVHDVGDYGAGAGEQETYTSSTDNASLDGNGDLAIVARQQTPTDGETRGYSSARLETKGLFSATHGLIEARMQIPAGTGLWPAFWMLGDDIDSAGWPGCGEVDIMEAIGKNPFTDYGTLHGPDGSADGYAIQHSATSATALASGFHTYGISWSTNTITWLLDGTPYATVTSADLAPGQTWVFNQPFHLLLNLAVGGSWGGSPTAATQFPATLLVDWVRVYQ
jgi:beta-glucanase (GH16 family)